MCVLNRVSQLLGEIGTFQLRLISNYALSDKFRIDTIIVNRADYLIIMISIYIYFELEVTLVTPGGVP